MEEEAADTSNIRVICRFRPLNDKERQQYDEKQCVEISKDNQTVIVNPMSESGGPLYFNFDYVFPEFSIQEDVYNISAKPIVEAVMQGFNGTVFAYGQTSSGKTYTMAGPDMNDPEVVGIIPRMVSTVFNTIDLADTKTEFQVKVAYCEIYLEKIKDLLDPSKNNLKIHEDRTRGVFIANLTEDYVSTESEVYNLMNLGAENREIANTLMNSGSSRSHSIFILTITQTNSADYSAKTGKLYLVDLAGSEKVRKTGAAGIRLEEAKIINKSLAMLGNVITALTDGKSSHIPYRDSKLTRVLQDSLGGNSKTALIVTCSPSPYNEAETISTLRFGVRAKAIKNKPKVNREYTLTELKLMLSQAKDEIAKKDRIIVSLKKAMQNSGIDVKLEEKKIEQEEEAKDDPNESRNDEIYNEIIFELEELRGKLADEILISNKLKLEVEQLTSENEEMKFGHEFIYKQIGDLQNRMALNEELLQDREDTIEKLTISNEMLKKELALELDNKLNLESKLFSKFSEIDCENSKIVTKLDEENKKLAENLEEEIKKNNKLIEEIKNMNMSLKQTIKSNDQKKLQILEASHKQEKERWLDEKKSMGKELETRLKKVVELELNIEAEKEKYTALVDNMSDGERALNKRIDKLKRNLEQLDLMYHQLVNQQSILKVEKQVGERKIDRLNEKIKNFDRIRKENNEKITNLEMENSKLNEELKLVKARNSLNVVSNQNPKIKKVIKGGGDSYTHRYGSGRKGQSVIFENIQDEDLD